jgi:peptidoglycan-associated lipoprotein
MTFARRLASLIVVCLVVFLAVACHKKVPQQAPAPPPPAAPAPPPAPPPPPPPPAPAPAPRQPSEEELFARKSVDELSRELSDVFFDFNESGIREDARAPLQKDADWLKRWTSTQITIEGHCDSRGSAQYNLALGSRRAATVKDYLVSLGVPANRVTVISKGKEQPFCAEQTESCWQQNRRGHFIVTAK